ncbi:MAG: CoA transferase [Chloroflexota bacterium]
MKAFDDITVLACEQYEAGTTATMPMAFMGANVILVERPGTGQIGRSPRPPINTPGIDPFYDIFLTMNKKSLTLNLKHPRGVEIFKEIAKKVDIVHDNYGPGAMDSLGVGYEDLKKVNPRLIVSSVKGFGEGPYSTYMCMDGVAQATGSSISQTGFPDRPPVSTGVSLGDTGTGMFSMGAILAALHYREKTGEGQFVEVAMMETSMSYNRANYALKQAEKDPMFQGPPIPRAASTLPGIAPHDIYKTMDTPVNEDYLMIYVREPKQWDALLRVIGRTELIGNPKFKDSNTRWEHVDEVNKIIEDWTSKQRAFDAFHALAKAGVPVGVTQNSTQMMNDPHFVAREMIIELDHPHRGHYKTMGSVQRLSDNPIQYQTGPLLGQNNQEVLAKYLNYTHHDLDKLRAEGVI